MGGQQTIYCTSSAFPHGLLYLFDGRSGHEAKAEAYLRLDGRRSHEVLSLSSPALLVRGTH